MIEMLKWLFAIIVLALLSLLAIWCYARIGALKKPFGTHVETKFRTQILEKLRTVNELHTGIAMVQTIVTNSEGRRLLGVEIGSTKLLYVAVGQVRAGIDLSKLTADSIINRNGRLSVMLPQVEILDAKLDVENSYVYDVRRSVVLAPDAVELHADAQRKALDEITTTATRCGILEMAEDQAKNVLGALLGMMGFSEVHIELSSRNQEGVQR